MTNKKTVIMFYGGKYRVGVTTNLGVYLDYRHKQYKDFKIISFFNGDYRGKIKRFGINNFLRCIESIDEAHVLILKMSFDRI